MDQQEGNKILSEILGFYKYKVDNNLCMMSEVESAKKALQENMEIDGTIDDFAKFYGKSKDAVNGIIKRNLIQKPKRNVVLYPFHAFLKIIPASWRKSSDKSVR